MKYKVVIEIDGQREFLVCISGSENEMILDKKRYKKYSQFQAIKAMRKIVRIMETQPSHRRFFEVIDKSVSVSIEKIDLDEECREVNEFLERFFEGVK